MAKADVKHNSPDPATYHPNSADMPGTMLPRADKDGNPVAFDPNKPQAVIVDPYEEGGGFQVDFSELSKVKTKFNGAVQQKHASTDPSAFLKDFNKSMTTTKKPAAKPTNAQPTVTALDALPSIESLQTEQEKVVSNSKMPVEMAEESWQQVKEADTANTAAVEGFQDKGPSFEELTGLLNKQGAAIHALMANVHTLGEAITSQKKEEPEMVVEEDEQAEVVESGTDTQIPFLTAKPQRPQYETYFEMAKMGTMSARYHSVVEGQDCIALIYDTRFEDGFQYLPPNLGEEKIGVSVPRLNNTKFMCSSLGLHWSLGCLDVVILIKHGGSEA